MADLPKDMFQEAAPFTYCAVDMFGPFKIKAKRSEIKSYGAMFTCLASRAVHIDVSHSITIDSFIQLTVHKKRKCETNPFGQWTKSCWSRAGAEQGLIHAFNEMDPTKIQFFLRNNNADWIKWKRNPSASSYMSGIWERQIRSARGILESFLQTHGPSLQTLMAETEGGINSRPMTVETINEVQGFKPLSPSNLLTTKSKVEMPPP